MSGAESCFLCGARTFEPIFSVERFPLVIGAVPAERNVPEYPLTICACQECSLVQQISRLAPEAVDELYTSEYYSCPSPVISGMGTRVIENFLVFFREQVLPSGELLEIACFDGYLLLKLAELGWSVHGCDPNSLAKIAAERLGSERVSVGFFKTGMYPADKFDVIVARNLLEHIYELHEFLQSVAGTLKKGGLLFIEVPNVHKILELGLFASFFHQHITYFSQATLSRLLLENGFVPERWDVGMSLTVSARKLEISASRRIAAQAVARDRELIAGFAMPSGALRNRIMSAFADPKPRVALFGASAVSTTILALLSAEGRSQLVAIFDNDQQKHGKLIHGSALQISAPTAMTLKDVDSLLIASYLFEAEIREQLRELGFPAHRIKSIFSG